MSTPSFGEVKGAGPLCFSGRQAPAPQVGAKAAVGMAQAWERFWNLQGPRGQENPSGADPVFFSLILVTPG